MQNNNTRQIFFVAVIGGIIGAVISMAVPVLFFTQAMALDRWDLAGIESSLKRIEDTLWMIYMAM